jgi:2-polyprenyl-3-methyl-5-hydroxy-6-metoxy-1,4-benzoquinol methylase
VSRAADSAGPGRGRPDEAELKAILREQGFEEPESWLEVARARYYRRVPATRLERCPHCGTEERRVLAGYVYYSNRAHLVECPSCGLWYSTLRLNAETVRAHFERAYKDEAYFEGRRRPILGELAGIVAEGAPEGGRVLDVGGAKGHLLARLAELRPDLRLTLSDMSETACDHARSAFGLDAVQGGIGELAELDRRFDALVLGDVIYYEPELAALWRLLDRALAPGGLVVIRVPNKARWIRLRLLRHRSRTSIPIFNPEHLYVFTARFLVRELRRRGFRGVEARASRLLGKGWWVEAAFRALRAAGRLVPGAPLTPSMVVVGTKGAEGDSAARPGAPSS